MLCYAMGGEMSALRRWRVASTFVVIVRLH